MKRWYSTKVSASGPAYSHSPCRNTRSRGTNTSSKMVVVSSILRSAESGCSKGFFSAVPCGLATRVRPGAFSGTAKETA